MRLMMSPGGCGENNMETVKSVIVLLKSLIEAEKTASNQTEIVTYLISDETKSPEKREIDMAAAECFCTEQYCYNFYLKTVMPLHLITFFTWYQKLYQMVSSIFLSSSIVTNPDVSKGGATGGGQAACLRNPIIPYRTKTELLKIPFAS